MNTPIVFCLLILEVGSISWCLKFLYLVVNNEARKVTIRGSMAILICIGRHR
jgi:hypothetical protein